MSERLVKDKEILFVVAGAIFSIVFGLIFELAKQAIGCAVNSTLYCDGSENTLVLALASAVTMGALALFWHRVRVGLLNLNV